MIDLDRRGERVVLRSAWDPSLAGRAKSLPGWSWAKTRKEWSWPLTMSHLRALRREFGDELRVSAELMAWARDERATERHLKRLAGRDDARLLRVPDVAPTLAQAMAQRTYQRVGAAFGARAGSFLLADEPGLGKTATALAALIEMDAWHGDHLVIAPKASLSSVWERQINRWTPGAEVVAMPEGKKPREAAWEDFLLRDEPRFLVLNVAMLRRKYGRHCPRCGAWEGDKTIPPEHFMQDHPWRRAIRDQDWPQIIDHDWTSAVLDESHRVLAPYVPSNVTQQVAGLLDLRAEHRIALTGTPLRGHERRIWGALDWLGHKTGGFWAWIETYFETTDNGFGKEIGELAPGMSAEFYRNLDRHVLRRTRAEVRKDLPLGARQDVLLPLVGKHRAQYQDFERDGEVQLSSGMVSGQGTLSELTRLRQMAYGLWSNPGSGQLLPTKDSPKYEWLMEFLTARGVAGAVKDRWLPEAGSAYKYVIASQFSAIIDELQRLLDSDGVSTLKITGAVTGARRNAAVGVFQSTDRKHRVMLLNTMTGGESIELDAWCDEMVILDETYVADDQVQLEGRINNRSGRVAPRTWWYLRTAETIEQTIAESNWMQHDLQHRLLDGRRGVTAALHLIRKDTP